MSLKKLATIVYIYNISQLSLLLVTTKFQLFQQKKNKQTNNTNATGGLISSVSRGPANHALYFLKYFHPQATPKCSWSVVLDVGLCYFKVPVKSKLNHPPWAFELLGYWVFKFPPPRVQKPFKYPILCPFQLIKFPPKILITWP